MRFRIPLATATCLVALVLPAAAQGAPASGATRACPGQSRQPTAANLAASRAATLCLINSERRAHGLHRLKPVAALTSAAASHAKRMAREDFFDHTEPNGSTFMARIRRTNYLSGAVRAWSVGENLAWGTGQLATPEAIVTAWMKSPAHRRNILTARYRELGLGVCAGAPRIGISDGQAATYVNEFGSRQR